MNHKQIKGKWKGKAHLHIWYGNTAKTKRQRRMFSKCPRENTLYLTKDNAESSIFNWSDQTCRKWNNKFNRLKENNLQPRLFSKEPFENKDPHRDGVGGGGGHCSAVKYEMKEPSRALQAQRIKELRSTEQTERKESGVANWRAGWLLSSVGQGQCHGLKWTWKHMETSSAQAWWSQQLGRRSWWRQHYKKLCRGAQAIGGLCSLLGGIMVTVMERPYL